MYHSWLNSFYGTSILNLHSCILSVFILIIPSNIVDRLKTLYVYVCGWKLKKRQKIETINKTFDQMTRVMQVAWALIAFTTKNDDPYILDVNASCCIFWNKFLLKLNILYNILDIVSQFKDNELPISVTVSRMLTDFALWSFI